LGIKDEYCTEITKFKQLSEKFTNRLFKLVSTNNPYEEREYILDIRGICYNITIMFARNVETL
jgi:thermostable 8-oxoguanine DNA glycosylase